MFLTECVICGVSLVVPFGKGCDMMRLDGFTPVSAYCPEHRGCIPVGHTVLLRLALSRRRPSRGL